MRRLLLAGAVLVVVVGVVAALAAGESGRSSEGVADRQGLGVSVSVTGPPEVVFRWATDRCDEFDIPDMPARAFRDADGRVQLLDTHIVATRFLGPDLNRVRHDCTVDGIKYREDSVHHLAILGYLTIERGADTLTISHGPRTKALAASFRKHLASSK